MPTESGGTKSRSGGMSVSLAGPDGRVLGGGLAGLLVAAGPVQVEVFINPGILFNSNAVVITVSTAFSSDSDANAFKYHITFLKY